ncbi:MAG: hypothetical protein ACI4UL_05355 [Muribaculaceae bacterium]
MSTFINLVITSDNYFDTIKFQSKTAAEQVAYLMFYVTEIAHLRKDMTAAIIADRINDQFESFFQRNVGANRENYRPTSMDKVEEILQSTPDWFQKVDSGMFAGSDRSPYMSVSPFRLTDKKKEELWRKFDDNIKSKIDFQKRRLNLDRFYMMMICLTCLILSCAFIYQKLFDSNDDLVVTSIHDYATKIDINTYNPTKKGILFVYYVTELTKMRDEVNLTAIHDRIIELGCAMPTTGELETLLDNTEMLRVSSTEPKAYSLTNLGINYAEDVVISHIKNDNGLNIPRDVLIFVISCIVSLFSLLISVGYKLGKQDFVGKK